MTDFERVYTVTDYHDGPLTGVADFKGHPNAYSRLFDATQDEYSDIYELRRLDEETFRLALESWEIWLRWKDAETAGLTTIKTHPALPADHARHDAIDAVLPARVAALPGPVIRSRAVFRALPGIKDGIIGRGLEVHWIDARIDAPHPERVEGAWFVLEYPANPTIRFDARLLDRILVDDSDIVLEINEVRVVLRITGGVDAARDIAALLAPYTRYAPITHEVYEDAKRRLEVPSGLGNERSSPALFFGDAPVISSDEILHVGDFTCWLTDVERYALAGMALPLPNGAMQAAWASLVVAARRRKEDPETLAHRVKEYEDHIRDTPPDKAPNE